MLQFAFRATLLAVVGVLLADSRTFARGGTRIVAEKGQAAHVSAAWPGGVEELVNDPSRTTGWNSWFSEWPNDVNQYGFEIASTADVNRLIEKLAAIDADLRQVRLSYMKEPKALGWVTSLPEGNNTAVIFSIGDQSRIDEWYKRVRKPFGRMDFLAAPIAVPPTLTIFVQNESVDLDKLEIPEGITVESGYLPAVFHRFNTTLEKKQADAASKPASSDQKKVELDSRSQAVAQQIDAFLKKRGESGVPDGRNKPRSHGGEEGCGDAGTRGRGDGKRTMPVGSETGMVGSVTLARRWSSSRKPGSSSAAIDADATERGTTKITKDTKTEKEKTTRTSTDYADYSDLEMTEPLEDPEPCSCKQIESRRKCGYSQDTCGPTCGGTSDASQPRRSREDHEGKFSTDRTAHLRRRAPSSRARKGCRPGWTTDRGS